MKLLAVFTVFAVITYVFAAAVPDDTYDDPAYKPMKIDDSPIETESDNKIPSIRERRTLHKLFHWNKEPVCHCDCSRMCKDQQMPSNKPNYMYPNQWTYRMPMTNLNPMVY